MSAYTTKIEYVIDTLRQKIIEGHLHPGERLRQEEVARQFAMSATPVREALRRLEAEGLVTNEPHRGVRVAAFDPRTCQEIYTIRSVLEGLAARLATANLAAATLAAAGAGLSEVAAVQQALVDAAAAGDVTAMRRLNYSFHLTMYRAAGSPLLLQMIEGLMLKSPLDNMWVVPRRVQQSLAEHDRIMAAVAAGDAELAGSLVMVHIAGVCEFVLDYAHASRLAATERGQGRGAGTW